MKFFSILLICLVFSVSAFTQSSWKKMSESDLKKVIPEKAPVIKENIETEFRTASGIVNGQKNIFGVVIITAGYEADGKYTHFFKTDEKLKLGEIVLNKGEYIFGYKRLDNETLDVSFYQARDGKLIGSIEAKVERKKGAIYSFLLEPPVDKKGKIYIGRFSFEYSLF